MKAAILSAYGNDPEVLEVDRPALPDDSVMIEVHAASINPIDWIVMAGYVQAMLPYKLPWIVGYDVSGVVVEVGPAALGFSVGDEVFARANGMQAGTMAEYSAVKASDLALKPSKISHAEAAGIPSTSCAQPAGGKAASRPSSTKPVTKSSAYERQPTVKSGTDRQQPTRLRWDSSHLATTSDLQSN